MSRNPSTLTRATNLARPQSGAMDTENVFVPDANEVLHTRGVIEHNAAEEPEQGAQRPQSNETEPHGMYWHRQNGQLVLRPHQWFIEDVAKTADKILEAACTEFNDKETQALIRDMGDALRSYVECRRAINDMAGDRKLKGEADDACYQLAQAAKYYIDAMQAAQRCVDNGYNIDGNKRIESLQERTSVAMREGYMLAQSVILAAPTPPAFDMKLASRRVVEYSCRKLTEWFAARRQHEGTRDENRMKAAALELSKFLKR